MCYRKTWQHKERDMNEGLLRKCIEDIGGIPSIKEVVLGGIGEPTFAGGFKRAIEELRDYDLTLTTNGTLMEGEILKDIAEHIKHVVISIDGSREVFYQIRKFPLEKIIHYVEALNQLKKAKKSTFPMISFQMVLSSQNEEDTFKVIDLAASLGVSSVILSHILPATKEDSDLVCYTRYENERIKELFKRLQNHAFRKAIDIKLPAYQLKTERRCRFIEKGAAVITAGGDVAPCYRFAHDGTEVVFGRLKTISAYHFGSIETRTLKEIWDSKTYKGFRETVFNNHYPSCTDCDLGDGCDMIHFADMDCYSNVPSCGDCLWARKLIYCI